MDLQEVTGAATGLTWRWQFQRDRIHANGERYRAVDEHDRAVLVHVVPKEPLWSTEPGVAELQADDLERARRAVEVASIPAVAAAEQLRRLVDTAEDDYTLKVIWEWADVSLHEHLSRTDLDAELPRQVEAAVSAGLDVLHQLGLVHCDVAPNNVLRVDGVWKLADFDNCGATGDPIRGLTMLSRYVPEGARIGIPASPELDREALRLVVARVHELVG